MDAPVKKPGTGLPHSGTEETLTLTEKRALAKKLLIQKQKQDKSKAFRLSYGQEALFFIYQNQPQSGVYNEGFVFRLTGVYREDWIRESFRWLVFQHPVLNSRFFFQEDLPLQEVVEMPRWHFESIDASDWTSDQLRVQANQDFEEAYRLEEGYVFRVKLYRQSSEEAVLLIGTHHIVSDGWSMNLLLTQFLEAYNHLSHGQGLNWSKAKNSYRDFVRYQRQWLKSAAGQNQLDYWKNQLEGLPPMQDLPFDRPRQSQPLVKGAQHHFELPAELLQKLKAFSKTEKSTLFALLLTAFHTLLYRYHHQKSNAIGIPVINRTETGFEDVLGCFVNSLAIRADLNETQTFRRLLAMVHSNLILALEHQELPFAKLVETQQLSPEPGYNPIFQSFFYLRSQSEFDRFTELLLPGNETAQLSVGALSLAHFPQAPKGTRFDLSIEWIEGEEKMVGIIRYKQDLFEAATIQRFGQHYLKLLENILLHPDLPISRLPLLGEQERHTLLHSFNDNKQAFPVDQSIGALLMEQSQKYPQRTALRFADRSYTYADLERLSNQLANCLREQYAIGAEQIVVVRTHRNDYYVIALLGVLKAGGAFLPIAPDLPKSRQDYLLKESQAVLVLSDEKENTPVPIPVFSIPDQFQELERYSDEWIPLKGNRHQLTYVLYTSGSTGKPKGVMIEQGGMLNHLYCKIRQLELDEHSVLALTAPISFDISIWQALSPLLVGGCTQVYSQELVLDPLRLSRQVTQDRLTILELVPSYLSELLQLWTEEGAPPDWSALRYLVVTGETLSKNVVQRWFAAHPTIPLVNAYGPTEASDDITHAFINKVPDLPSVPIGKSVDNLQVYILDELLQLCPIGIKGEICVAGIGVGRGYLNDPEKTRASFPPNPFGQPGERLYRTGDIGRFTTQGELLFYGRRDAQVKIRGHRIELGEIEENLTALEAVSSSIVMVRQGLDGPFLFASICSKLLQVITRVKHN